MSHHEYQFLAFGLSFVVIGSFWWSHHQLLEHVVGYSRLLVAGMFLWILSIVFLPFPTEVLSVATNLGQGVHGLYIGTMLAAAVACSSRWWPSCDTPSCRLRGTGVRPNWHRLSS